MTEMHPLGLTGFELRELALHPHAWEEPDNIVAVERRIKDYPEWIVTGRFYAGGSGLRLMSLTIEAASFYPWPPSQLLNTAVVRNAHLDDLHRRARAAIASGPQIDIGIEVEASTSRRGRPGKVVRPDIYFANLASRYLQLVETSDSPVKDLAAELNVSVTRARERVHEARRRNLLTEAERGVAGGELTRKALRLLGAGGD